ncbi:MAG: hypothetical protein ACM3SS_11990 [Rhodospirillaceae bacterium]
MANVNIELVLSCRVYDRDGRRSIGRLEDVLTETERGRTYVMEYHVGAYALLERLAAWHIGRAVLGALGQRRGYRVRWDQLDLSDPRAPRLCCDVSELKRL